MSDSEISDYPSDLDYEIEPEFIDYIEQTLDSGFESTDGYLTDINDNIRLEVNNQTRNRSRNRIINRKRRLQRRNL